MSDHAITRAALDALLREVWDDEVVASESADDLTATERSEAAVILVADATTQVAIASVAALVAAPRTPPVLVLSGDDTPAFVRGAFAAGARGVITTAASLEELAGALRAVADGVSYLHPSLGAILAQLTTAQVVDELSEREREVLRLIAFGLTNPEIAGELVVSVRTVETHRAHLTRKLHARTRADLVRHAIENGLVSGAREGAHAETGEPGLGARHEAP